MDLALLCEIRKNALEAYGKRGLRDHLHTALLAEIAIRLISLKDEVSMIERKVN